MHTTLSASKQWAQRNQTAAFLLKTVIGANVVALLAQLAIPQPWGVAISAGSLGVMVMGFALGRNAAIAALTLYVSATSPWPAFWAGPPTKARCNPP